jgi:D-amino-acid oxidase
VNKRVAIVGSGVTGLTCAIALAENGYSPEIFATAPAENSTSGAAAAIWYPYEAKPLDLALVWGMITFGRLLPLAERSKTKKTGVSLLEFRFVSRKQNIQPDPWARAISYRRLRQAELLPAYKSGYAMRVPLIDTSRYLDYLRAQIPKRTLHYGVTFKRLEQVDDDFDLIVNCTGYHARRLVRDKQVVGHRGQIVIVRSLPAKRLTYAFVCVEKPLTYVIPRGNDCVLGGSNDKSTSAKVDPKITSRILDECSRVLQPILESEFEVIEPRAGLRPHRVRGVRLTTELLKDGRRVVHNYGHAGAGYSLSWGCAHKVAELVRLHLTFA